MAKVMLVEDDLLSIQIVSEILRAEGHEVVPFNDGTAAPSALNQPIGQLKDFMRDQESAYIQRTIAQAGGDKEQAAKALGVSLATLYRRLAEGE